MSLGLVEQAIRRLPGVLACQFTPTDVFVLVEPSADAQQVHAAVAGLLAAAAEERHIAVVGGTGPPVAARRHWPVLVAGAAAASVMAAASVAAATGGFGVVEFWSPAHHAPAALGSGSGPAGPPATTGSNGRHLPSVRREEPAPTGVAAPVAPPAPVAPVALPAVNPGTGEEGSLIAVPLPAALTAELRRSRAHAKPAPEPALTPPPAATAPPPPHPVVTVVAAVAAPATEADEDEPGKGDRGQGDDRHGGDEVVGAGQHGHGRVLAPDNSDDQPGGARDEA